jgi:hypothetical protein
MRRRLLSAALAAPLVWLALVTTPAAAGASGLPAEFHAPRIPGPGPATPPGALHSNLAPVRRAWTSSNWSGYAISAAGIHSVTGTWKVPTVIAPTTHKKRNAYSGTWVGIDGFNNSNLIQAGTEQDWTHKRAFYQAWWEILPAPETPIPTSSVTIHPGDSITVTITEGTPKWTITLTDNTTHRRFSTQQAYRGQMDSAEWIHEAVTVNGKVATIPHDSTFAFDNSTVNGAGPNLVAADSGSLFQGGVRISTPSAPDSDRDGFAVAYGSVAPRAPLS